MSDGGVGAAELRRVVPAERVSIGHYGLMDPISAARDFVAERHPDALASILGGSTAQGRSTSTSDLDIVVLYPDGGANYARTTRHLGQIVEEFVHTPASVTFWYARERAERCAILGDLCAQGIILTGAGSGLAESWQRDARRYMQRGPEPLSGEERNLRRYELSNSLDDLRSTVLRAESFATSSEVFRQSVELLLLQHGKWLGKGKWLVRRLEQLPADDTATALRDWAGSPEHSAERLIHLAARVLEANGGYLMEGFLRGSLLAPGTAP